ncbi:hypothetical protein CCACVL1_16086 [Corchorus capsularis]|uniref:Uncharacterized protein n=1 Tax=Corchorus capsularis TaxID=210143 RepID=A0A1R3HZ89_COCAP|nr:hypothetical protein CCACVL1_16086 [Corchorus capsularis]
MPSIHLPLITIVFLPIFFFQETLDLLSFPATIAHILLLFSKIPLRSFSAVALRYGYKSEVVSSHEKRQFSS